MGKFSYLIIHQCNVCCVYCDITSDSAHCNTHISSFQCGSIVDSVADHTDPFLFFLIRSNPLELILRQTVPMDFFYMQLPCNGTGSIFVVSGEQNRLYFQLCQMFNHPWTFFSHSVGKNKIPCQNPLCNYINHGTALVKILLRLCKYLF